MPRRPSATKSVPKDLESPYEVSEDDLSLFDLLVDEDVPFVVPAYHLPGMGGSSTASCVSSSSASGSDVMTGGRGLSIKYGGIHRGLGCPSSCHEARQTTFRPSTSSTLSSSSMHHQPSSRMGKPPRRSRSESTSSSSSSPTSATSKSTVRKHKKKSPSTMTTDLSHV